MPSFEKAKIRDRSEILARQLYPNASGHFVETQVGAFLDSFRGRGEELFPRSRGFDHHAMAEEFSRQNQLSERDMDAIFRESQQSERMYRDFEKFRGHEEMEMHWKEGRLGSWICSLCAVQNTERMVEEFQGLRPIERVETIEEIARGVTRINDPKLQARFALR